MRRPEKRAKKLRLKVVEARRKGMTYEEIRRRYHVSPSTISRWTKGLEGNRYCVECGETDPTKLEQHHPDKINRPSHTVWLCANCHAVITRRQAKEKKRVLDPISQKLRLLDDPSVRDRIQRRNEVLQLQQAWNSLPDQDKGILLGGAALLRNDLNDLTRLWLGYEALRYLYKKPQNSNPQPARESV